MKNKFYFMLLLIVILFSNTICAQVGMGTKPATTVPDEDITSPKGVLHLQGTHYLNDSVSRNVGLVLPKVDTVVVVQTPGGNPAVEGSMVFTGKQDSTQVGCVHIRRSNGWQDCLADNISLDNFFNYDVYGGLNVRVKKVSAGYRYSLLIGLDDGAVYAGGSNANGETGLGTTSGNTATFKMALAQNVIDVSAGYAHALAATQEGVLWTWGDGANYKTAQPTTTDFTFPIQVKTFPSGVNPVRVEAGYDNSLVLGDDGKVYAFGANTRGVNGNALTSGTLNTPTVIAGLSNIKDIALSSFSGAALDDNGNVWTWGNQAQGRLGNGSTANIVTVPVQILSGISIKQVAMGTNHGLAITTDGKHLYAWGAQPAVGINNSTPSATPTDITAQLTSEGFDPATETILYVVATRFTASGTPGSSGTAGGSIVITDKNVYAAGSNNNPDRYGLGYFPTTTTTKYSPATSPVVFNGFQPIYNQAIYPGTTFVQASMGVDHSLMAQTVNSVDNSGGYGYGMGRVDYSQLGAINTGFSQLPLPTLIKK